MQGELAIRAGALHICQSAFDTLVDSAFTLIEHRVGQQTHIVRWIAQRQLENRDGLLAAHASCGEDRRQALVGITRMTQHVLKAAIAEHQLLLALARPERQLGNGGRLPGLHLALARQVEGRKQRQRYADHADQGDEERDAENEQQAPRQGVAIAARQQQPDPGSQHRATQAMRGGIEQRGLMNREIADRTGPTPDLKQRSAAKQPLADHSMRTR